MFMFIFMFIFMFMFMFTFIPRTGAWVVIHLASGYQATRLSGYKATRHPEIETLAGTLKKKKMYPPTKNFSCIPNFQPHTKSAGCAPNIIKMTENIYDEIEIEDMTYDPALEIYHYPCPCGDRFEIAIADLRDNEDIAVCPSCSLMIRVIYEVVSIKMNLQAFKVLGECEITQANLLPVKDALPKAEEDKITTDDKAQVPIAA